MVWPYHEKNRRRIHQSSYRMETGWEDTLKQTKEEVARRSGKGS